MGVVYRAKDQKLGREVAIKVLPDAFGQDPVRVARFDREARAAAALNHPNICAIHEIGEHEGQPFIVMELMKGQTLEARLSTQGRLDCDEVLELAARNWLMRWTPLMPPGSFIATSSRRTSSSTDRGQAKILDFGVAKTNSLSDDEGLTVSNGVGTLTGHGTTLGTVAYMSPEQALGRELDSRTDLFSMGVVIYEALTGQPPFMGATSAAVFDQILNRAPPSLVERNRAISPELERVVSKLLEKDAGLRYQHASELRADLKRMRRDTDSGRHQQRASVRAQPRWRALTVGGAAALGVLAVAATAWWARSFVGPAPAGTSAPL